VVELGLKGEEVEYERPARSSNRGLGRGGTLKVIENSTSCQPLNSKGLE